MQEKTRVTAGYAALGLAIGLFLFPWIYLPTVRTGVAELANPVWTLLYFAIVLVPGVILGFVGSRRAQEPSA